MNDIAQVVNIIARLLPDLVRWVVALAEAGKEPESEIRRNIRDLADVVVAQRAAVDEALASKHSVAEDPR